VARHMAQEQELARLNFKVRRCQLFIGPPLSSPELCTLPLADLQVRPSPFPGA
jgi:hypothetical protein